jgi:hypothetical protein
MNNLEYGDMCVTSSYEEYLRIHKALEDAGVPLMKSHWERISMGLGNYEEYPNLYWDNGRYSDYPDRVGGTSAINSRGGRYNVLTVDEFLDKAGAKPFGKTFNNGHGLIHRFI